MDPKALKKLAAICRSSGIKHYKCADFEFTLTDEAPVSNYKKRLKTNKQVKDNDTQLIQSEGLTEEDLLFYSVGNLQNDPESVQ